MPVVIDKLLAKPLLHNHTDKVDVAGDVITGDIYFPLTGFILKDADDVNWRVTVDTSGALVTTAIINQGIGSPWLFLFGSV